MLIFLVTLRCDNSFVKIYDLMSLCMKLQKPNPFLLYKTCIIFELKSNFLFIVTKKNGHTVYLFFSKTILYWICTINQLIFNSDKLSHTTCPIQHSHSLYFFLQAREEGNSKLSYFFPKIVFVVSFCYLYFFFYTTYLAGKTTKKFNFELLCLCYILYIWHIAYNMF